MGKLVKMWHNVSDAFYKWVLSNRADDYNTVWINNDKTFQPDGIGWALLFVLLVSFVVVLIYYYGVSKKPESATKKNYLITCLIGYITLVVVNIVALKLITKGDVFTPNMLWVCVIDVLYYLVFFELFSLAVKNWSNARHIDLISIFKK